MSGRTCEQGCNGCEECIDDDIPQSEKCKWCNGTGNDERDEGYDSKKYPCGDCNGTGSLHAVDAPAGGEPIYQIRRVFVGESSNAWHDASQKAYDFHPDHDRRIVYASPSAPGMASVDARGWLPIGSAPKDGTNLLLRSVKGHIANGQWGQPTGWANPQCWVWPYVNIEPAHWQPLP